MENKIFLVKNKKTNKFYGVATAWVDDPRYAYRYYSLDEVLKYYGDGNRIYNDLVICEYELVFKKEHTTKRDDFYFAYFNG